MKPAPLDFDELLHRHNSAVASAKLMRALDIASGRLWPCDHQRTPETTQRVGQIERCRVCRRHRWNRAMSRQKRQASAHMARLRGWAELQRSGAQRRGFEKKEYSRNLALQPQAGLPFDALVIRVADEFGLAPSGLFERSRAKVPTAARSVVNRVLYERGVSLPVIGELMDRDHTTVLSSIRHFPEYAARDATVSSAYAKCRDRAHAA